MPPDLDKVPEPESLKNKKENEEEKLKDFENSKII